MRLDHSSDRKRTVEDLLQLKRSERPPESFWSEFDARLREKQLAALIPVASGWSRLFSGFGRFSKFGVPVAAAAAVAVGVLSVNRQVWQGGQDDETVNRRADDPVLMSASAVAAPQAVVPEPAVVASAIRTVVIEAAHSVVAAETPEPHGARALNADEISRTLPWLANVDLKHSEDVGGLRIADSLKADHVATTVPLDVFRDTVEMERPVWAPTTQNIRAAVASEIGIAPSYLDRAPRGSTTGASTTNAPSRYLGSRIDSEEYRGDIPRVGVTGSTLSIKF